ncbi:M14 family zinc carboxypeptidase [Streptomyces sp. NBC_00988]|uniref:M14 family zinc carboxypeptidase n=1 Tax=Streptomyces sp. NBC_00988 TaxID=2903704 RepID=UPI00386FA0A8|nr:M14 family zinc carboxypeptidase [Streptomyces sp. NBC_00988]
MWRCALPPLLRYPSVDELAAQAAALVARRPQDARLRRVGTSRAGTPLWLLSVGHGSRQALVVAGPHANEPVGGATVLRLAERVLADPRLSEGADATWNLLLCLDPDGSRRNEGWLPGPYSLGRYFRNFFRPGFLEQPEWLPDGAAGARLPETRALLEIQDELRPFLQCSLHGVDVGGGFVELTHDLPGLARRVAHTATRLGIPRELGPYDTLYWPSLGPAVYRIPPPRPGDLAAAITEAAVESTWYHPHRHGTITAVVEAPMWGVIGVENGAPPADADAFLRTVSHTLRHDSRILEQLLARIRPFVQGATEEGTGVGLRDAWPRPPADPVVPPARDTAETRPRTLVVSDAARLLAPVDDYLLVIPGLADAWDPDVDTGAARPLPPLNTAHLAALRIAGRRLALRTAGLLYQLVIASGRDQAGVLPELDRLIDQWCADYRDGCGARWISVARQVEYQSRVVLSAFELAGRHAPVRSRSGEQGWGTETAVPMHRE